MTQENWNPESIDSIPMLARAIRASFTELGMPNLIERLTVCTKWETTIEKHFDSKNAPRFELRMWDFILATIGGIEMPLPIKEGSYTMNSFLVDAKLQYPFQLRIVELGLDGSREKLVGLLNVGVN